MINRKKNIDVNLHENIRNEQIERINEIVDIACNYSEFYKELYLKSGVVAPYKIEQISDLKALPIVKKDLFRTALNSDTLRTRMFKNDDIFSSSTTGSTGQPMTMHFDVECIKKRKEILSLLSTITGMGYDKKVCRIWRQKSLSKKEEWYQRLGGLLQISVGDVNSPESTAIDKAKLNQIADSISSYKPETIRGYVSALYTIMTEMQRQGIEIDSLESVITSAEYLPDKIWCELEQYFNCKVFNLYGGTEAPAIALNFEHCRNLSIFEELYFVEVLDDEGNDCKPGEPGFITITDLYSKEVPLIRYQIGDIATVDSHFFEFNSKRRYFKAVEGRTNDIFRLSDGSLIFSHLWHIHLRDYEWLTMFKVEQLELDEILISLACNENDFASNINKIKIDIESKYPSVNFTWKQVEHIPSGKGNKVRNIVSYVDNKFNMVNK